jgi:hypothetical protein
MCHAAPPAPLLMLLPNGTVQSKSKYYNFMICTHVGPPHFDAAARQRVAASSSPNSAPEPRFFVDSDQQSTARSLIVTSRRDDKALHLNSLAGWSNAPQAATTASS